jgi:glycerol-3-phosphate dehydrogenase (NAD(P)+)
MCNVSLKRRAGFTARNVFVQILRCERYIINSMQNTQKISVIGAGAWGTALAMVLSTKHAPITLWCNRQEIELSINTYHKNPAYLGEIVLPETLYATHKLSDVCNSDVLVLATPSQFVPPIVESLVGALSSETVIILASKGLATDNATLLSDVVATALPNNHVCVLTGPSFAKEVAQKQPTAVVLAAQNLEAERLFAIATLFATPAFTVHTSRDAIGAQVGGIVKNVIAIACGMAAGLGAGENMKAALVTKGFAEMVALGLALGAARETLEGLAGLGDLLLTATSTSSRNYSYGFTLASAQAVGGELAAAKRFVVEGAVNALTLQRLASRHNVVMPLCALVAGVVQGKLAPQKFLQDIKAF